MAAPDLFSRLARGRPPTEATAKRPQKIQHAQKLLNWLQRWNKPTVTVRDIHIYGPHPARPRKHAQLSWNSGREWLVEPPQATPVRHAQMAGCTEASGSPRCSHVAD
jgi:hypothetical protein